MSLHRRRLGVALAAVALVGAGGGASARLAGLAPVKITSGSMAPTVDRGDWVIAHSSHHPPRRGEIVMFRFPLGTSGRAIKRVVAIAGDHVTYTAHTLTINGTTRPIAGAPNPGLNGSLTVPDGHVFVLGDHADVSIDSRSFGVLPVTETVGKIVLILP